MEQLDSHRSKHRSPMQKEEISPRSRVLHGVLDEVDDGAALELGEASEAEISLVVFNPDVSDGSVELECERENVVVGAAVTHDEGPVRLLRQKLLGRLSGYWTPIPPVLKTKQMLSPVFDQFCSSYIFNNLDRL